MQSADLTIRLPDRLQLPVPEGVASEFHREEMLSWQYYPDADVVGFLSVVVGDVAAVRGAIDALPVFVHADVTAISDDTCYVYAEVGAGDAPDGLSGVLADRRLVVVPPVVYTDPETVQVTVLGDDASLTGLLDAFPEDVSVEVGRVSDHERRAGSVAHRVTARQFEALGAAQELGYYDVPRTGSLADVASALECSESAASALLRKAESALVDAAVGR